MLLHENGHAKALSYRKFSNFNVIISRKSVTFVWLVVRVKISLPSLLFLFEHKRKPSKWPTMRAVFVCVAALPKLQSGRLGLLMGFCLVNIPPSACVHLASVHGGRFGAYQKAEDGRGKNL